MANTFGWTGVGTLKSQFTTVKYFAIPATMTSDTGQRIVSITVYTGWDGASIDVYAALYSDDGGAPGQLLDKEVAYGTVDHTVEWITIEMDEKVALSANTNYWLVYAGINPNQYFALTANIVEGIDIPYDITDGSAPGWLDTFVVDGTRADRRVSIYATYEEIPPETGTSTIGSNSHIYKTDTSTISSNSLIWIGDEVATAINMTYNEVEVINEICDKFEVTSINETYDEVKIINETIY